MIRIVLVGIAVFLAITIPGSSQELDRVVEVRADLGNRTSRGTGYLFRYDDQVLTAYHVVRRAQQIEIWHGDEHYTQIRVENAYPGYDTVILRIVDERKSGVPLPTPIHQETTFDWDRTSKVSTAGFVWKFEGVDRFKGDLTRDAIVSSMVIKDSNNHNIFNHDIAVALVDLTVYSGMSGAPVFYQDRLIGVLSGSVARTVDQEGRDVSWVIPISIVESHGSPVLREVWPSRFLTWPEFSLMNSEYYRSVSTAAWVEPSPKIKLNVMLSGGLARGPTLMFSGGVHLVRDHPSESVSYGIGVSISGFEHSHEYATLPGLKPVRRADEFLLFNVGIRFTYHLLGMRLRPYAGVFAGPTFDAFQDDRGARGHVVLGARLWPQTFAEISIGVQTVSVGSVDFSPYGENETTDRNESSYYALAGFRYEL